MENILYSSDADYTPNIAYDRNYWGFYQIPMSGDSSGNKRHAFGAREYNAVDMSKNTIWQMLLAWITIPVAIIVIWQLTMIFLLWNIPFRWWSFGLFLCVFHTILAFALCEASLILPITEKILWRLAFILSSGMGVLLWLRHPFTWAIIPSILLGSFSGCLIATWRHYSLWEDN